MKPTLLFATFSMLLSTVGAIAESELETLRSICAEQERQIRMLEDENSKLRLLEKAPAAEKSQPVASVIPASPSVAEAPAPVAAPPMEAAPPVPVATPVPEPATATYTVKAGDSLERIARKHGTSPDKLAKLNKLKPKAMIRPGQKLDVPSREAAPSAAPTPAAETETGPLIQNDRTHKVQAGETFGIIAKKHRLPVETLIAANPNVRPSALRPGQVIKLGGNDSSTTMISAPAPTAAAAPTQDAKSPAAATPSTSTKKIRSITIDKEMTFGEFAALHGTDANRLNSLNGLDLTTATVLAKGSELYVPGQP